MSVCHTKSSRSIALACLHVEMNVDYLLIAKPVAVTTWESALTTCSIIAVLVNGSSH